MNRGYVQQLMRSFELGHMTRREFVQRATIAIGSVATANFLLAACSSPTNELPAVAPGEGTGLPPATPEATADAAPTEAGSGLITEDVEYQDADGDILTGYLARPAGSEALPGAVVVQEWWGLDEHIKDVTRRLAQEGYVVLAPDLYHGVVVSEPSDARKLAMELDMANAVAEIQRGVEYLEGRGDVRPTGGAVVGFCMGGGLALQTAAADPDLAALVAFYGSPLSAEQAATVKAPVLGLYGAADQGIPADAVHGMEAALDAAGVENEFQIYDGAGHAFFNDTRPASYNEPAATDAWQRTLGWLQTHLGT